MTELKVVSALEAARLLGVNERTVRMWVKGGRLQAGRIPHQRELRIPMSEVYRIQAERAEQEQLAELPTMRELTDRVSGLATDAARVKDVVGQHDTELESQLHHLTDHDRMVEVQAQHIAEQTRRIQALEDARLADQERMIELERQLAVHAAQISSLLEQIQASNRPQTTRRKSSAEATTSTDQAGPPDLPPDLVGAAEFAEAHGINPGTAKSAFQQGRIPTRRGKWRGPSRNPITVALDAEGRARFHELYAGRRDFIRACQDCQAANVTLS